MSLAEDSMARESECILWRCTRCTCKLTRESHSGQSTVAGLSTDAVCCSSAQLPFTRTASHSVSGPSSQCPKPLHSADSLTAELWTECCSYPYYPRRSRAAALVRCDDG